MMTVRAPDSLVVVREPLKKAVICNYVLRSARVISQGAVASLCSSGILIESKSL